MAKKQACERTKIPQKHSIQSHPHTESSDRDGYKGKRAGTAHYRGARQEVIYAGQSPKVQQVMGREVGLVE